MSTGLGTFKVIDNIKQDIIEGTCFNGIFEGDFAAGETQKIMMLEIPQDVAMQFITQGISIEPFDNTFNIRILGDPTGLTAGTPISILRNMNRNISDIPLCQWTTPTGTWNNDGTIIEDYTVAERHKIVYNASKTVKDGIERIYRPLTKYIFVLRRDADTIPLHFEFRFLWLEY